MSLLLSMIAQLIDQKYHGLKYYYDTKPSIMDLNLVKFESYLFYVNSSAMYRFLHQTPSLSYGRKAPHPYWGPYGGEGRGLPPRPGKPRYTAPLLEDTEHSSSHSHH
eukprot:gnl/Spiro4/27385_TR13638_c0_g1_i1.p1 gnl/Spiro4/27385_TR13638_c0_g1~~gnl/Spiro4/27385_TR13638_c0_g1_i1.p1  ORF type:complete len:107 (-),score=12.91 gnl/Spiro4/27385_TR13638_c0_g1_i1:388-708(-)